MDNIHSWKETRTTHTQTGGTLISKSIWQSYRGHVGDLMGTFPILTVVGLRGTPTALMQSVLLQNQDVFTVHRWCQKQSLPSHLLLVGREFKEKTRFELATASRESAKMMVVRLEHTTLCSYNLSPLQLSQESQLLFFNWSISSKSQEAKRERERASRLHSRVHRSAHRQTERRDAHLRQ
jgi:hypothetical protein